MQEEIFGELNAWKRGKSEKPLIVIGARQIGKTYIIDKFCRNE
jgi:predicted AAA+ superfamily ATPase